MPETQKELYSIVDDFINRYLCIKSTIDLEKGEKLSLDTIVDVNINMYGDYKICIRDMKCCMSCGLKEELAWEWIHMGPEYDVSIVDYIMNMQYV